MSKYFLIPQDELQKEMIRRSVTPELDRSNIPSRLISSVTYYILEVVDENIKTTKVFNDYIPYETASQVKKATPPARQRERDEYVGLASLDVTQGQEDSANYVLSADSGICCIKVNIKNTNPGDWVKLEIMTDADQLKETLIKDAYVGDGNYDFSLIRQYIPSGYKIKTTYHHASLALSANAIVNVIGRIFKL